MSAQSVIGRSSQVIGMPDVVRHDVPEMSQKPTFGEFEVIDAPELAHRLNLPVSWVRSHTRRRTLDEIPTVRFGRYCRFLWNSPELQKWIAEHMENR